MTTNTTNHPATALHFAAEPMPTFTGYVLCYAVSGGWDIMLDEIFGSEQEAAAQIEDFWPEDDVIVCRFDAPLIVVREHLGTYTREEVEAESLPLFSGKEG